MLRRRLFSKSTHDVYISNLQISRLSRSGNIVAARQLFDKMPTKDTITWNTIITAYWHNGFLQQSKQMFELMPLKNAISYNSIMAGCIQHGRIRDAFRYFQVMPKPMRNVASFNVLISGFAKSGLLEDAYKVFQEMPIRNVVSYTAMIDGYVKNGEVDKARELFDQMPCKNAVSWSVMIGGYVESAKFDYAKELFVRMPDDCKNAVVITTMITGYCKQGMIENARVLFDGIQCKDLVSYNAMILGYARNSGGEEAFRLYSDMYKFGLRPDEATLVSVLIACSSLPSFGKGRQVHATIVRNGFENTLSVCTALVTVYSKCGAIVDSELTFRQIYSPNLVSWNTIITSFAQHGLYAKAFSFFNKMKSAGFEPDEVTFLSLLSAGSHTGNVNESMDIFSSMVKTYGIVPQHEHYACLVDTFCRAGQLEKACQIIQDMPFEADSTIWGSLLAASGVHLNVELAEFAAKKIWDLDPDNFVAACVTLSNIYAAAGLWRGVNRARSLMKGKKQRAYSWVEIGNKVHSFLGGDASPPHNDEIQVVLQMFYLQMMSSDEFGDIVIA